MSDSFLSITNSQSLLKLKSIESVLPPNHLILCHPLTSIFSSIWVFSSETVLHIRWPKIWSFSSSILTSNKYSGPISFRIDWFDLLTVQGMLKSLLIAPPFAFFIIIFLKSRQNCTFLLVDTSIIYLSNPVSRNVLLNVWIYNKKFHFHFKCH